MNNGKQQILVGVFCVAVLTATLADGSAVQKASGAQAESQASSCIDNLRQTMDVMHRQMHAIEPSRQVDEEFVRLMLPHHEAAIEMAKIELLCGKDEVNRRLAQEIITDQQSEIELMQLWLTKHNGQKSSRTNQGEKRP